MHEAHDRISMYEYGNTNLNYTTTTSPLSGKSVQFFRYCQVGFIRSGGIEIWPLLVRTVPSGVGDCCEALTSVGVVSS